MKSKEMKDKKEMLKKYSLIQDSLYNYSGQPSRNLQHKIQYFITPYNRRFKKRYMDFDVVEDEIPILIENKEEAPTVTQLQSNRNWKIISDFVLNQHAQGIPIYAKTFKETKIKAKEANRHTNCANIMNASMTVASDYDSSQNIYNHPFSPSPTIKKWIEYENKHMPQFRSIRNKSIDTVTIKQGNKGVLGNRAVLRQTLRKFVENNNLKVNTSLSPTPILAASNVCKSPLISPISLKQKCKVKKSKLARIIFGKRSLDMNDLLSYVNTKLSN